MGISPPTTKLDESALGSLRQHHHRSDDKLNAPVLNVYNTPVASVDRVDNNIFNYDDQHVNQVPVTCYGDHGS